MSDVRYIGHRDGEWFFERSDGVVVAVDDEDAPSLGIAREAAERIYEALEHPDVAEELEEYWADFVDFLDSVDSVDSVDLGLN